MKSPVDLVRITRLAKCCVFADTVCKIAVYHPERFAEVGSVEPTGNNVMRIVHLDY